MVTEVLKNQRTVDVDGVDDVDCVDNVDGDGVDGDGVDGDVVNVGDGVDDGDGVDGASPGAGPTSTATSACSPWTTSRSSRTRGRLTSCWSTMIIARFIVIASED